MIPGNDAVREVLGHLRAGSVVELRGRLVDIEGQEGGMTTSLSRSDTGRRRLRDTAGLVRTRAGAPLT